MSSPTRTSRTAVPFIWIVGLVALTWATGAFASPSGLNNIPTADTASAGVLVLQAYSNLSSGDKTTFTAGAKYGLMPNLEIGVDYGIAPDSGPVVFQAKKAWWPGEGQTGYCLGIAGVTDNWSKHHPFPYGVISHKFTDLDRGHIGFAPQEDAQQFFVGYDHQFPQFLLRADYVRDTDASSNMYSIGGLFPTKWGAGEAWVTRVDGDDDDTIFTLKLDYAIDFNKSE